MWPSGTRRPAKSEKRRRLDAQDVGRADGRNRCEDRCYFMDDCARRDDTPGGCGGERPEATRDDDRPYRERDADAERRNDDVDFRVVAIFEGLIPAIEHLGD